ncbi:MAG TPA: molybdenum cofactor guanylyltransferase [Thermoanaerobaculia bacterium]|nr:molybdenum cofactor guanylyltransferase [Thermoanaerobaculia bacterium]
MRIPMPAAVLAGGASRRMGRPKAELPYGAGTLLAFQVSRLAELFEEVLVVAKAPPASPVAPARVVLDRVPQHAAIHGLVRALAEADDRLFVLAVDLPAIAPALLRAIAERSLATDAAALVPRADGRLQPLAAVWRRSVLAAAEGRIAAGQMSLQGLAEEVGAEVLEEVAWRAFDPSGTAFTNLNTLEQYAAQRERA